MGSAWSQDPWTTADQFAARGGYFNSVAGTVPGIVYSGGGSWTIRKSLDGGATWTTDADTPQGGPLNAMAVDLSGAAYAAGNGPPDYWLVRKSAPGSWASVDTFQLYPGQVSIPRGMAISPATGSIFVAGQGDDSSGRRWVVRRSNDEGATWTTVDSFQARARYGAIAYTAAVDLAGRVYVGGEAITKSNVHWGYSWIVRRSADNGGTWTTVDAFDPDPKYQATASSFATDGIGTVYAAGYAGDPNGNQGSSWIVRKSSTGLAGSWTTVDAIRFYPGHTSIARSLTIDAQGAIYVAGWAWDGANNHWLVRKSLNGGATWSLSDQFPTVPGGNSVAYGIGWTASGLFATGQYWDTVTGYWVARKLGG
jgi:hypothetical protein